MDKGFEQVTKVKEFANQIFGLSQKMRSDFLCLSSFSFDSLKRKYDKITYQYILDLFTYAAKNYGSKFNLYNFYHFGVEDIWHFSNKKGYSVNGANIELFNIFYITEILKGTRKKLYLVLTEIKTETFLNNPAYIFKFFKMLKGKNNNFIFKSCEYLLIFECDFEKNEMIQIW